MASEVRQNYHSDCEAGVNKLIRLEMDALYLYLSLRSYFYNSRVELPGIAEYFKRAVEEEMGHMQLFIDYQNKRGGKVKFEEINKPEKQEWASGLEAMRDALKMEKAGYDNLLELHRTADSHGDYDLANFLESHFMKEVVDTIKEMGSYVTQFERVGAGHGEYHLDKNIK